MRQIAELQKALTAPPDSDLTMSFLVLTWLFAFVAWASVSKTATPTVTETPSLV